MLSEKNTSKDTKENEVIDCLEISPEAMEQVIGGVGGQTVVKCPFCGREKPARSPCPNCKK